MFEEPPAGKESSFAIRSFPEDTRSRIQELEEYFDCKVLHENQFVCQHHQECLSSCGGSHFYEGQLHHIGKHYDIEIDGKPSRLVMVGQEYGHPPSRVGLRSRSNMIRDSASSGFRGRNPHMKGTTSLLRLLLRRAVGDDELGEKLFPNQSTHIFEGFALVNYLLCSAVEPRDLREVHRVEQRTRHPRGLRGQSSASMQKNCANHFLRAVEILDPTIIVLQGFGVRNWLGKALGLQRHTKPIEQINFGTTARTVMTFMHPSAPSSGWWGNSLKQSKYLQGTVIPTVQTFLDQNC